MGKTMCAIGLMSGTSMDGIDVAQITSDGEQRLERGPSLSIAYEAAFRGRLAAAIAEARGLADRRARSPLLAAVERELTDRHADAVRSFLAAHDLSPRAIAVIGFHGHTVLHAPQRRLTVQIGDGWRLAELTGIDVVADLRAADCAAGGQGAPLAPVYHRALAARVVERPLALLNIGGVANVTYVGAAGELLAFDTGPGNAMIDDWMQRHRALAYDADGALAASGLVHEELLARHLRHRYFAAPPPKSLDRNAFVDASFDGLSPADGAATLTAFTAASIAAGRAHLPVAPGRWIVAGGGRHNRTLMGMLAERLDAPVTPAETAGIDGDALEAEAWAYLAVRALQGLPLSFPGTTGVPVPISGGVLCKAAGRT
jgi:anhydro-N-acetylmuramic acid kinase